MYIWYRITFFIRKYPFNQSVNLGLNCIEPFLYSLIKLPLLWNSYKLIISTSVIFFYFQMFRGNFFHVLCNLILNWKRFLQVKTLKCYNFLLLNSAAESLIIWAGDRDFLLKFLRNQRVEWLNTVKSLELAALTGWGKNSQYLDIHQICTFTNLLYTEQEHLVQRSCEMITRWSS